VLRSSRPISDFILIGGTSLALRIQHRLSEDLDFVLGAPTLPTRRILLAMDELAATGTAWERHDNPSGISEFEDSGLELHDYQQDFRAGGVKITFFTADSKVRLVLADDHNDSGPRLATLDEIFATKCLVSASRSRTRDWFDLHALMTRHGYSLKDYLAVFKRVGSPLTGEIGLSRLCSGKPDAADEGIETLTKNPPTIEELRDYFCGVRDEHEIALAREAHLKE